jgi:hypothetical protein
MAQNLNAEIAEFFAKRAKVEVAEKPYFIRLTISANRDIPSAAIPLCYLQKSVAR